MRDALIAAVARGVDVNVMGRALTSISPLVRQASRLHYGDMLEGGRVYEYRHTMMHNKTMVVDGVFSDDRLGSTSTRAR